MIPHRYERAQNDSVLHVSHSVPEDFEFFYEPFYVASDDAPQHDERFLGYGYTRNTQVRDADSTCGINIWATTAMAAAVRRE